MSVYFAQVGPYVKVGFSYNPERRVARLFASETTYTAPADCPKGKAARHLIAAIPGDRGLEHLCHVALDDFAVGGEFFVDEPGVREFIANALLGKFQRVTRADGPVTSDYDERDLSSADFALLAHALGRMFDRSELERTALVPHPPR